MKKKHDRELQRKVCADFGADLDSELCAEVGRLMEECPECRVYYDTMTRSVKLYRAVEDDEQLPDEISERLFRCLDLDDLENEKDGE